MKQNFIYIVSGLIVLSGTSYCCYIIGKTRTEDKYRHKLEDLLRRIAWLENGITKRP